MIEQDDRAPDPDIERAWLEQVQRRHREILEGNVETVPGEQVFESLRTRLRR